MKMISRRILIFLCLFLLVTGSYGVAAGVPAVKGGNFPQWQDAGAKISSTPAVVVVSGNAMQPGILPVNNAGMGISTNSFHYTPWNENSSRLTGHFSAWKAMIPAPGQNTGAGIEKTGTVTWIDLEGGFFGIIADDGVKYDPVNLPSAYAKDGTRVSFRGSVAGNAMSFHMWGIIIQIDSIQAISSTQEGQGVFIEYRRTGGIAGFNDHMIIYENRTAIADTRTGERIFIITPSEKSGMISMLDKAGFNTLRQEDLAMYKVSGNDFFFYLIDYRGHKIEAIEMAFPESMGPVIQYLDGLVYNR